MKFLNAFNLGFLHRRNSSAVFSRTSGFDKSQNNSHASETLGIRVLAPPDTAGASVGLPCGFFWLDKFCTIHNICYNLICHITRRDKINTHVLRQLLGKPISLIRLNQLAGRNKLPACQHFFPDFWSFFFSDF